MPQNTALDLMILEDIERVRNELYEQLYEQVEVTRYPVAKLIVDHIAALDRIVSERKKEVVQVVSVRDEERMRWVKASEELPEANTDFFVKYIDGPIPVMIAGLFDGQGFYYEDDDGSHELGDWSKLYWLYEPKTP